MRRHRFGGASSMFSVAKSAKDSIGRVASETRGAHLLDIVRSKAHSLTAAADGAARRATSVRQKSKQKVDTRGGSTSKDVDEANVKQMCDMGFSNAAARLALAKNRSHLDAACNWLFDEQNLPEIEAAEAADLDGTIEWFRARPNLAEGSVSEEAPEPTLACAEVGNSEADEPFISQDLRRKSLQSDDGCGLGRFLHRESFPSPRQVPFPGRLSRGTCDSPGCSAAGIVGSRPSNASDNSNGELAEIDRTSDFDQTELVSRDECRNESLLEDSSTDQEAVQSGSRSPRVLLPPDSACWDWPLSRHEKKTRVQLIERQIFAMDRHTLLKEVNDLRKTRTSSASVTSHETKAFG